MGSLDNQYLDSALKNDIDIQTTKKKDKKPFHLNINIGMIVFLMIVVYLIINFVIYLGRIQVSVVEVQRGTIVDDGNFNGIIMREEQLVYTTNSGYINYYIHNGSKVAKNNNVYMLNTTQTDMAESDGDGLELSDVDYRDIREIVNIYTANYTDSRYSDLYDFKYDLQNQINEAISNREINDARLLIESGNFAYLTVKSATSGIVSYIYDHMENLSRDMITDDMFTQSNYSKVQLTSNQWIDSGSPAFKLTTSENWSIIIKLTDEQANNLKDKSTYNIRFVKDGIKATAAITVFSNGESQYAELSLNKYMVRYISDRYIEIELIASSTSTTSGLKIPTTAIVNKDFYKIPLDYLIEDESTNEAGFYKKVYNDKGELTSVFYKTTIYHEDSEYCYVDLEDFQLGDYIGMLNSDQEYRIGAVGQLTGVYNINRGYAIFRLVQVLYQNDEYCIVKANTPYGIALYDRIILNADTVSEDQLIYE